MRFGNPNSVDTVILEAPVARGRLWRYPWLGLILGSAIGVLVGHPLAMVVLNIHRYINNLAPLQIGQAILHSFHPDMWPMILLYAVSGGLIGLVIGLILRSLREHRLRLDAFHQEFELQVAALRHHYKNLAYGIHGFSSRVKRKLEALGKRVSDSSREDPASQEVNQDIASLLKGLTVLDDAAQRLTHTLGQELLFLRAVTSDTLNPESQDFIPLLVHVVQELQGLRFRDKAIQVIINGQPLKECRASLVFPFEPYTMEVILHNIIGNAMKFADRIDIRVEEAADHLQVEVADNGPGLDVRELQQYLTAPGPRREAEGTHLGLKVTLHLLQKVGGQLAVRSRPGAGAAFILKIPVIPGSNTGMPSNR
jgi:signal transduction histidine kinase